MAANSFDIVSRIDLQEVRNAIQQSLKEIRTRYDLKSSQSAIELDGEGHKMTVRSEDDYKLRSIVEILNQKLAKRGVPLKGLSFSKVQPAAGSSLVQEITLQQGIPAEKAHEIVKLIKNLKLKVQPSIQGDQIRVTGKNRDDLQAVIAMLKEKDLDIDMQFTNYRST